MEQATQTTDNGATGSAATGNGNGKATKTPTAVETVSMQDGRVVEFAGKRKLLKESLPVADDKPLQIRLDFRNGQSRLFTIPDTLLDRFALHGAEQKLGDEIAGLDDVEDCVLAIDELIDRLYQGNWGVGREAGGMAGTSILLRALVEAYPQQDLAKIKAFLGAKTQAEKIALRNSAKIKPIVERLEAAKAAKGGKVDAEKLLADFESGDQGQVAVVNSVFAQAGGGASSDTAAGEAATSNTGTAPGTGEAPAKPKGGKAKAA